MFHRHHHHFAGPRNMDNANSMGTITSKPSEWSGTMLVNSPKWFAKGAAYERHHHLSGGGRQKLRGTAGAGRQRVAEPYRDRGTVPDQQAECQPAHQECVDGEGVAGSD